MDNGNTGKTSVRLKAFYSCGQLTDSIPFNLFYIYFLYFITDVVGMPAAFAGAIALIIVVWDALTDPVIGFLSDNCRSKYGRRRPFMVGAVAPLFVATILLFTAVDFGAGMNFLYYVVIGMLFWTCYKTFVIPYFALGAELTQDFTDRTNIRGFAALGIYISTWIVSAGPMVVLDKVEASGGTEAHSWLMSAVLFGLVGLAGGLICWKFTRGHEIIDRMEIEDRGHSSILANYRELFRLKAFRRFLFMTFIYNIAFAIANAALVYMMDNNLQLSAGQQATYWTIFSVINISFIPLCNVFSNRYGKKQALITLNVLSFLGCFGFFIHGIGSFQELIVFTVFYNIGNVAYWSVGYSMMYDCAELDEYVYGKRREGAITGFSSFMQKFGSAIGMYITGGLLAAFGYDGTASSQTQQALDGIITVNTLIPGLLIAAGTVFIILYPVTEKRFRALLSAIQYRKNGLKYPQDLLKKLF